MKEKDLFEYDGRLWKVCPEPFSEYAASIDGLIIRIKTKHILTEDVKPTGYVYVKINLSGKYVPKRVHRIVAKTFIPNSEGKPEINHRDGNRRNNSVDNLEWVTRYENVIDATKRQRAIKRDRENRLWWGVFF